jgi:16S rRNA (uracil1498-N3)-methyltransferase
VSGFRPRFFVEPGGAASSGELGPGTEVTLNAADSHHALHVLRLQPGDECEVVVGAAVYAASVMRAEKLVRVSVTRQLREAEAGARYRSQVGLVQVLTRPALFDQVLEKGTEVGASFFVFVPAVAPARSSGQSLAQRSTRWRRIVSEAAKQSKQVAVPVVEARASVREALEGLGVRNVFSLALDPAAALGLRDRLEQRPVPALPLALWVGPEGGWSTADRETLTEAGVEVVRLGRSVLRAETAGPVAVAAVRLILGDW